MSTYDRDYGRPISVEEAQRAIDQAQGAGSGFGAQLVSPSIAAMRAYPPAKRWKTVSEDLGIAPEDVVLLAANENAMGPSPLAVEAAKAAVGEVHLYPDGAASQLKNKIAHKLDVAPNRIVVGNGSNEIIELLVRTFVGNAQTVLTAWPSFVVYRLVAQAHSRDALLAPLTKDRYDLTALASMIDHRTKLVFIANPNNPTGTYVTKEELAAFLDRIPRSVIVVLDEAYIEYTRAADFPNGLRDFPGRPRLVVLRTFSKMYGLAGLRVGYGVMDPELVDYIERVRQPYNANTVAQAAACAALDDDEHVQKSRAMVHAGMEQLEFGLSQLGLTTVPSQANFLVVRLPIRGGEMQDALRHRGVLVRSMEGYGVPDAIRVTVGTKEMNAKVLAGIEAALAEHKGA